MKKSNNSSLTNHRNSIVRSIQTQHRQMIKAARRQTLPNLLNPAAEAWRLKNLLATFNIQYFSNEIAQIIRSLRLFSEDVYFRAEMRASRLFEDLICIIIGDLVNKAYLDAPLLTEMVVELAADLLNQRDDFLQAICANREYLLYAVFRYPLNNKIVKKVAYCLGIIDQSGSIKQQNSVKMVQQAILTVTLFEIYFFRESYQLFSGPIEFIEVTEKGEGRWFQQALYAASIIYRLLLMCSERQCIIGKAQVREGLLEGLKVFISRRDHKNQYIDEQFSDCETFSQSTAQQSEERQAEETQIYLVSEILDIYSLRQLIIEQEEGNLLKKVLEILLSEMRKTEIVRLPVLKAIRILYQHVILDEEDLSGLSMNFPELSREIGVIVSCDQI